MATVTTTRVTGTVAPARAATRPTFSDTTVSLAAAYGITPRTVATWHPELVRTPRLMVPIELDALMVRSQNLTWAQCGMDDPSTSATQPVAASSLLPKPFATLPAPRVRGAYLQWYLPNAFTSATADETGTTFPPIPDRWLMLRLYTRQTTNTGRLAVNQIPRRSVRGWVLEAGGQPATSFDLSTWTEPGTSPANIQNPLTAMGHGDISWAGYFDNVLNRLSFADTYLDSDEAGGPISYLVCGWFSDPTLDPLGSQNLTTAAAFNARMKQLGWSLPDIDTVQPLQQAQDYVSAASSAGLKLTLDSRIAATQVAFNPQMVAQSRPWWPQACVLHGAVVGITWPGNTDTVEVGGPPNSSAVTVAFGNTMAETMGAIVAQANSTPDEALIVEALQLGVLKQIDQPDGRAQVDVDVHANSFTSLPGLPATSEPFTVAPSGVMQAPPASPIPPAPGIFGSQTQTGGFHGIGVVAPFKNKELTKLKVSSGQTHYAAAEESLVSGRLRDVISYANITLQPPLTSPGGDTTVQRAKPRFYTPKDPIVLIQGGKRAFTHDSGVQTDDGMIVCRMMTATELSWQMPQADNRYTVRGPDILESGVENGSVPLECEVLLQETALLDPGGADAIYSTAAAVNASSPGVTFDRTTAMQNIAVEQTAWYSLRQPGIDHGPLLAYSGITGTLPAAFSVSPAAQPWSPMHLDWEVEYVQSPNGIQDWTLGEIDYTLNSNAVIPQEGSGIVCQGRAQVTGGASNALATAVANAIKQASSVAGTAPVPIDGNEAHFSIIAQNLTAQYQAMKLAKFSAPTLGNSQPGASGPQQPAGPSNQQPSESALLTDISTALSQMDVLSTGLSGLLTQLRGMIPGDGVTQPDPTGSVPTPFFAMRGGFLRIKRLRLVDGFGQFVDLCGSSASQDAQGFLVSPPLTVPTQAGILGLPPRFTAPVCAWFRYMDADPTQPTAEADYQTSPVCGFLMPNHLEGSIECFNADGSGAGSIIPQDDDSVGWQVAPGISTAAGQDPLSSLTNSYAANFARGLINWGIADVGQNREAALSALLRCIDSTLWSVDPFGHQGDEHLSFLLGHPVCIMRGLLELQLQDPVTVPDNTVLAVPIRLGNLTQWVDGLLGYFVNDDYSKLYVADPAVANMARPLGPGQGFLSQINLVPDIYAAFADDLPAGATTGQTPVTHPYVETTTGEFLIRPNQVVKLTLLVEPLTTVHATMGLAPRKEIGMRRQWVTAGLAAIAPTFRFGPVLVDPNHIRMPVPTDLGGTWVWDYRSAATQWAENPATNATYDALLPQNPPSAMEGWLKLEPAPPKPPQSGSTS